MSPILLRMMSDLKLLSLEEQWKLLSHLINQLRAGSAQVPPMKAGTKADVQALEVDGILQATQGCWGNASVDQIDATLNHQRQFDWDI
ncbi:hypothetical protein [Leptolyngbya sp. PCC 6406]|uniref:hypothetical protein n=1 Tax=Leptolyngbya sp. PCC 6406 TaxID=1173264 RepID=UPI0002AB9C56|nr:hypothetical protein [Leptolyngbya sp. PCC 6406]